MPDMTKPYAHIEAEADRLKYEAQALRRDAKRMTDQAELMEIAESRLRDAIDKQIKADADRPIK
jgi:hypothetical protein